MTLRERVCNWDRFSKALACVISIAVIVTAIWAASGVYHVRQMEGRALPDTVLAVSMRLTEVKARVHTVEKWLERADARWAWQACMAVAGPEHVCDQWLSLEDRLKLREMRGAMGPVRDGDNDDGPGGG